MEFAQAAEEAVAILLSLLGKWEKPPGSPGSSQDSTSSIIAGKQNHLPLFCLVMASL